MKQAGTWTAFGVSLPAILLALGGAVAGIALVGCADDAASAAPETEKAAAIPVRQATAGTGGPRTKPRYIGAAGCAAAMCHGGGGIVAGESTPVGSEYTYWLSRDPHAHAYAALLDPVSVSIIRNLRASPRYADLPEASEASICLTCHSISPGSTAGEPNPHGLQGGVSCEACHGPAEHWLEPHKRADWKELPVHVKQALGFQNTEDLIPRIQLCSECHVGGARGDVNHDLIAAGHPRMSFEFSAYHTNLPPHWDVEAERREVVGASQAPAGDIRIEYETRLWAVGQVVVARQALELLRLRAGVEPIGPPPGEPVQPVWPEFSELNCFDCHHRLETESWRKDRDYADRRPGNPSWGTWAYPLLPLLSDETGGPDLANPAGSFRKLEREMIRPYPDREEVRRLTDEVTRALEAWAAGLNDRDDWHEQAGGLLDRVAAEGPTLVRRNWDTAAQTYLAVAALIQPVDGTDDSGADPWRSALESIHQSLRFDAGDEAGGLSSPADYGGRVQTIIDEFQRLPSERSR